MKRVNPIALIFFVLILVLVAVMVLSAKPSDEENPGELANRYEVMVDMAEYPPLTMDQVQTWVDLGWLKASDDKAFEERLAIGGGNCHLVYFGWGSTYYAFCVPGRGPIRCNCGDAESEQTQ